MHEIVIIIKQQTIQIANNKVDFLYTSQNDIQIDEVSKRPQLVAF